MSNPFMQLYVADYLGDTRHLTTEQHGAYLLLLMTMWRADGVLPNDDKKLARIVGCTSSRWARIKDEVLEFFDVDKGELTNPRLKLELKKASEKSNQRAEAGSRGGKAKALKTNKADVANATDLLCHSSEPEPDTSEAIASSVPRAKRKHFVPDGWAPNEAHTQKAQTLGLDLHEQAEAFREFEFDKPKADFDLAFHRWLRTARKFSNDRPANQNRPGSAFAQPSRAERDQSAALEVLARRGALPRQDLGGDIHDLRPSSAQGPGGGTVTYLPAGNAA